MEAMIAIANKKRQFIFFTYNSFPIIFDFAD